MDDGDFFINISGLGPSIASPKPAPEPARGKEASVGQRTTASRHHAKGINTSPAKAESSLPPSGKRKRQDSTYTPVPEENPTKKSKLSKQSSTPKRADPKAPRHDSSGDTSKDIRQSSISNDDARTHRKLKKKKKMVHVADSVVGSVGRAEHGGGKGMGKKQDKKKMKPAIDRLSSSGAQSPVLEKPKNAATTMKLVKSKVDSGTDGIQTGVNFTALNLHESLKRQLEFLKFNQCTPIQALAVPAAIDAQGKRDVLIRASTGSGKTLAFLLPVLHQLLSLPSAERERRCGTLALILSPTKELALQTLKVSQDLLRMVPSMVCGSVAGGEQPKSEKARLRKGLAVLCATPGRLAYHLEQTASFVTVHLRCLVLDEADRLLDLGFEPQIRRIYKMIKEAHENHVMAQEAIGRELPKFMLRSLLVSATLSPAVRHLANFCLKKDAFWADPESEENEHQAEADDSSITFSVPKTLTQWYCVVPCKERLVALIASIVSRTFASTSSKDTLKAIVFFASNASVDFHHDIFKDIDWPSISGFSKSAPSSTKLLKKRKDGFIGFADQEDDEEEDEEDEEEDEEEEEEEEEGENEESGKEGKGKRAKIFADTSLFKLHGNLGKEERAGYIQDFSKARGGVLLSSDAASRGLDFPQIDWIIQFDPPQSIAEYLHRIGRTARIGRRGNALLFLQPHERGFLETLRSHGVSNLKELDPENLPQELLQCGAPEDLRHTYNFGQLLGGHLSSHVAACEPLLKLARAAFISVLQSYRAFPRELRSVFPFHELHTGHFASSFALRETPMEASRLQRRGSKGKGGKGKGKDKDKGKGGGKGKDTDAGNMQPSKRSRRNAGVMDEFS